MKKVMYTVTVLLILGIALFIFFNNIQQPQSIITTFEECSNAGYPIMESYPRQCRTPDGKTFVEEIGEPSGKIGYWEVDDIVLMRIPETGELACFGCGKTMCKDPVPGLDIVDETPTLHCDEDLEVIRTE